MRTQHGTLSGWDSISFMWVQDEGTLLVDVTFLSICLSMGNVAEC